MRGDPRYSRLFIEKLEFGGFIVGYPSHGGDATQIWYAATDLDDTLGWIKSTLGTNPHDAKAKGHE